MTRSTDGGQLTLDFSGVGAPLSVHLAASGLRVMAECPGMTPIDLHQILVDAGVMASVDQSGLVQFHCSELLRIARSTLAERVVTDHLLAAVWELALVSGGVTLVDLSVVDGDVVASCASGMSTVVPFGAVGVLLACGLPVTASDDAWKVAAAASKVPLAAGKIAASPDGMLVISTSKPQMVEHAPIPGLWKVTPTEYRAPACFAGQIAALKGFTWTTPVPAAPSTVALSATVDLADHLLEDTEQAVRKVIVAGSAVIDYRAGLGRRTLTLAVLSSLEAFPALIVTSPAKLWAWHRNLDMFGVSYSSKIGADVRLVTFNDLSAGARFEHPAAIVVDDLADVTTLSAQTGMQRLDAFEGSVRLCLAGPWPDDIEQRLELMRWVKPAEFPSFDMLSDRYPVSPERNAAAHIDAFVVSRRHGSFATATASGFPRSTVLSIPAPAELIAAAAATGRPLETLSAGSERMLSPKVTSAAAAARSARAARHRTVVVSRFRRTVDVAASLLRDLDPVVTVVEAPLSEHDLVVLHCPDGIPDLSAADTAVFVDVPVSLAALDAAVGDAASPNVTEVILVHMTGSPDDRLAVIAANRKEHDDMSCLLSADELAWVSDLDHLTGVTVRLA